MKPSHTYRGVNMFAIVFDDADGNRVWAVVEGGEVTRTGYNEERPDGWQLAALSSMKGGALVSRDAQAAHARAERSRG